MKYAEIRGVPVTYEPDAALPIYCGVQVCVTRGTDEFPPLVHMIRTDLLGPASVVEAAKASGSISFGLHSLGERLAAGSLTVAGLGVLVASGRPAVRAALGW